MATTTEQTMEQTMELTTVHQIKPIAYLHGDFTAKFGLPRQSGLAPQLQAVIVMQPEFRDLNMLRGLEEYSHLWLIWQFSHNLAAGYSPTVRPPRLGGNQRRGLFATRTPFRPNALGLSAVRLEAIQWHSPRGPLLQISGADLLDGTPIYDIKPYLPLVDSIPTASGSFSRQAADHVLPVICPPRLLSGLAADKQAGLLQALSLDPRPGYQHDEQRVYSLDYAGCQVSFRVSGDVLTVLEIRPRQA